MISLVMHLSMLSPREGGRANHGSLIVRSVPRVGILFVQRTFYHLHLPPGGHFDQLFCPRGGTFEFFKMKMSKSPPHARAPLLARILSHVFAVLCLTTT